MKSNEPDEETLNQEMEEYDVDSKDSLIHIKKHSLQYFFAKN